MVHARLPERPKGADCKSAGSAFVGSNPSSGTAPNGKQQPGGCFPVREVATGFFYVRGAGSGSGEGLDVVLTTFVAKSAELAPKMRLEWPPGQPICVKRSWVVKLTQASSDAVKTIRRAKRSIAPLAQSAERFHGKEKVDGSIPSGGSVILCAPSRDVRHRPLTVRRKVALMAV